MEKNPGISCAFYTVKQLAALFGKSEDTIRRWKNEGVGREDDNIKLRALEREDGFGRKNARHLVFSREAVIEFVKANPFLMDDAPQLGLMMQAEGAWSGGAIPLGGSVAEDGYFEDTFRSAEDFADPFEDRRPRCENPYSYFRRPIPDFDEDEFEEEEDFSPRRSSRRPSRSQRRRDDLDREEMVFYIESVLEKQMKELETELQEVNDAVIEINLSSDFRGSATVRKLLFAREEELKKNIRYLEEFLDYIEEERS